MGFLSSMIKNIIPVKFRAKLGSVTEKPAQGAQPLTPPAKERTTVAQPGFVLPPRVPLPPGVYEELIQKRSMKFVEGFWKRPELSSLKLARIKRQLILAGYDWPTKPHADLSKKFEGARATYYHPIKIKRLEKIEASMKKMPELLRQHQLKLEKEKSEKEALSFKTEQDKYMDALNAGKRDTPEWLQENVRQAKLKKRQAKQLTLTAKMNKKK